MDFATGELDDVDTMPPTAHRRDTRTCSTADRARRVLPLRQHPAQRHPARAGRTAQRRQELAVQPPARPRPRHRHRNPRHHTRHHRRDLRPRRHPHPPDRHRRPQQLTDRRSRSPRHCALPRSARGCRPRGRSARRNRIRLRRRNPAAAVARRSPAPHRPQQVRSRSVDPPTAQRSGINLLIDLCIKQARALNPCAQESSICCTPKATQPRAVC